MTDYELREPWEWDILKAARERWSEMAAVPRIVYASPGSNGLDVATCDRPLPMNLPDRLLEDRPLIQAEHIDLETVGPYRMGYGTMSCVLCVTWEAHVAFTTYETVWQSRELDTSGGGPAFVSTGGPPIARL